MVVIGVGMGFTFPTFSAAAMGSLPREVTGVGSGALNTLRQVGFSIGVAVLDHQLHGTDDDEHRERGPRGAEVGGVPERDSSSRPSSARCKLQSAAEEAGSGAIGPQDGDLTGDPSSTPEARGGTGGSGGAGRDGSHLQGQHRQVVLVAYYVAA